MNTEIQLDVISYHKVICAYRSAHSDEYNSKGYTFCSENAHYEGDLVVVEDQNGYSLVKVLEDSKPCGSIIPANYKQVQDLDAINKRNYEAKVRDSIALTIREAVIKELEDNAFKKLVETHPHLAPMVEKYKALGGDYTKLMPKLQA